uniref:DUF835 domain-containing protein n=1 Tax=uncultured marine group II/III euryarchaeote AD1000_65_C10 TaxID=1457794 RepID=A0A075G0U5_9EURY|nr:hypothetical protein [uncultured marine group II/III euryarchaeote AD1000_65_C10]
MTAAWPPGSSRVYGIQLDDPREGYVWLQQMAAKDRTLLVLSRLAPTRLSRWINLQSIRFHWVTNRQDKYAIDPALEKINHFLNSTISSDSGIIWLDAVEYLADLHGFDSLIHFVQSLADELVDTNWTLVLPYSPLAFESTQVAKIRREAPNFSITEQNTSDDTSEPIQDVTLEDNSTIGLEEIDDESEIDDSLAIEVEPGFVVLSRIPEKSLSRAILQRRLEQWKGMGFDVSELEPVVLVNDRTVRHQRYFAFEEKVRRATECERRIRELEQLGFTTSATKLHFRIMQLTGLDEVESEIQKLLAEAR